MTLYRLSIKIILAIFFLCTLGEAQAQHQEKLEKARTILQSLIESNEYVGLSAAIAYKGEIILAEGFGFKNLENKQKPDSETLFRIYSISKTLAGILAMKLVDEGKLDLEQSIAKVIPELPEHLHQITPKDLLAHLSGIRHYKGWDEWNAISQDECRSPMEALDVFINDPLLFNAGEKVEYTSFGYVLLSAVLEKEGGKPFTQLMQEKLFNPSNAKRIFLDNKDGLNRDNISTFYDVEDGKVSITRLVNNSCKFGGGGYNASAEAVAKVLMAYMEKSLFSVETYQLSLEQAKPDDGSMIYTAHLGIGANTINGLRSAVSNGAGPGGRSTIYMFPDDEIAVVLIGNSIGKKLRAEAQMVAELFQQNKPE